MKIMCIWAKLAKEVHSMLKSFATLVLLPSANRETDCK